VNDENKKKVENGDGGELIFPAFFFPCHDAALSPADPRVVRRDELPGETFVSWGVTGTDATLGFDDEPLGGVALGT
jgi:hypothetical protein